VGGLFFYYSADSILCLSLEHQAAPKYPVTFLLTVGDKEDYAGGVQAGSSVPVSLQL